MEVDESGELTMEDENGIDDMERMMMAAVSEAGNVECQKTNGRPQEIPVRPKGSTSAHDVERLSLSLLRRIKMSSPKTTSAVIIRQK